MTKKNKEQLEHLKKEEKRYFDTYKQKRDNSSKISHLRKMADIIEEIDRIENE